VLPIFRHKMRNFEIARPALLVSCPRKPVNPGRLFVTAHPKSELTSPSGKACGRMPGPRHFVGQRAAARNCPVGRQLYAASLYAAYTVAGSPARPFTKAEKSAPAPIGQTRVMAHWSNGGPKRTPDPIGIKPRNKRAVLESLHPHRNRLPFTNSALIPLRACGSIGKSLAICIVQPMLDQYRITNHASNGPRRAGRKSQRRSNPCSA
jgi:hypothetical protein